MAEKIIPATVYFLESTWKKLIAKTEATSKSSALDKAVEFFLDTKN